MRILINNLTSPKSGGIARDAIVMHEIFSKHFDLVVNTASTYGPKRRHLKKRITTVQGLRQRGVKCESGGYDIFFENQFSSFNLSKSNAWHMIRVHDIFPITNPEWFKQTSVRIFKNSIQRAVENEKSIFICNSSTTFQSLVNFEPKLASKSFIIYCQPRKLQNLDSFECFCDGCEYLKGFETPYLLMVGTVEPRKDYDTIISLCKEFDFSIKILVVGNRGWKTKPTQRKLRNSDELKWIPNCCDFALQSLYRNCEAFLSTSIDEGFNLPAGEAFLYQKSMILPNLPIYHELYGTSFIGYRSTAHLAEIILNFSQFRMPKTVLRKNYLEHNENEMIQLKMYLNKES